MSIYKRFINTIVLTILSTIANDISLNSLTPMPIFNLSDLVRRTFFMPANKNRQHFQVRIVKAIEDQEEEYIKDLLRIRFICSVEDN